MLNRIIERLGRPFSSLVSLSIRQDPGASFRSSVGDFRTALSWSICGPRLLVAVALSVLSGDLLANYSLSAWWLLPFALCGAACGWAAKRWKTAIFLILLPAISWSYCLCRMPRPAAGDLSLCLSAREVIFSGQVADILPSASPENTRALVSCCQLLFPSRRQLQGATILTVSGGKNVLEAGDQIEVRARVTAPSSAVNPWDFDYARYLRRKGVFSLCTSYQSAVKIRKRVGPGSGEAGDQSILGSLGRELDRLRLRLTEVHEKFAGHPEGELLESMVLGDRTVSLPADITGKFRDLGLSHILAASGFNITVVTGVTWWTGRFIIRSVWALNLLCFSSMILYVGLAGPSPSVVRAAFMCSFVLLSRCLFRSLHGPAALSLALLLTLVADPGAISDVGLELSYAATAGIVGGAGALASCLGSSPRLPLPKWLSEALSVVLVAQAAVVPIQLAYFWQIGLLFLPANLIVTPIVTVVTVLGFISSALIMLDFSAVLINTAVALIDGLSAYPLKLMLTMVDCLSACEEAKLHLGPPVAWSISAYYLSLAFLFVSLRAGRYRSACLTVFTIALAGLLWRPALPAFTFASFPGTVILLDRNRQSICLGDAAGPEAARFLLYFGAKPARADAPGLQIRRLGPAVTVIGPESRCIAVVDGGAPSVEPAADVPPCSVIVITGPVGRVGQSVVRPPAKNGPCPELPYTDGPADVLGITEIVKKAGARWIVINSESRRFRRRVDLLEKQLHEVPGVRVLRTDRHEFMLIADGDTGTTLDFKQVLP